MYNRILAVDLGKQNDSSAIVMMDIVERRQETGLSPHQFQPLATVQELHVVFIERPPLGTLYTDLVDRIDAIMKHPDNDRKTYLVIDQSGIGQPVCDFLRKKKLNPIGITITAGEAVNSTDTGYKVSKAILVSTLQIIFKRHRIKISGQLPMGVKSQLLHELKSFQAKIKTQTKNVSYEAAKEEDHDDIVMALAIGVWIFQRFFPDALEGNQENTGKTEYDVLNYGLKKE